MRESPFERALVSNFAVEGRNGTRILSRLRREGVPILGAKFSDNGFILTIRRRDCKKLFAICEEMCYNIIGKDGKLPENYRKGRLTFKRAGEGGFLLPLAKFFRRPSLIIGAALTVAFCALLDRTVLGYSLEGVQPEVRSGVVRVLEQAGAAKFASFSSFDTEELADLIVEGNPDVRLATVFKRGSFLVVETIVQTEETEKAEMRDATSPIGGVIEKIAVLRGTPLVQKGDEVRAGDPLVGAYFTAGGERIATAPVYEIDIRAEFTFTFRAMSDSEYYVSAARAVAIEKCPESHIIGTKTHIEKVDGGFEIAVTVTYIKRIGG